MSEVVQPSEVLPASAPLFPVRIALENWPSWILGAWLVTSLILLSRLAVSFLLLHRRKSRAVPAPVHIPVPMANRRVRVALTGEMSSPVAAGPFRPAILIPARVFAHLEESELNQIILHEVAHFNRRDDYWLIVQRVVQALFVFHPVVHWITRRIDLEREIACDDFVINRTGGPRRYALCLTRLVEISRGCAGAFAASAVEGRSHLERRVDMLLNENRKRATHVSKTQFAAVVATLAILTWFSARTPHVLVFAEAANVTVLPPAPLPFPAPFLALRAGEPIPRPAEPVPQPAEPVPQPAEPVPQPTEPEPKPAAISANPQTAPAVRIPVLVRDSRGRFVSGLEAIHFRIREDGAEQTITEFFASTFGRPRGGVSVVVVTNAKDSSAIPQVLTQSLLTLLDNPDDEYALIRLNAGLEDGVRMAISRARQTQNSRKAIVIVSEGPLDGAVYAESTARAIAAAADVPIYALSTASDTSMTAMLNDLARFTGGQHHIVNTAAEAVDLATKVLVSIGNYYVLSFQPTNPAPDGRYRAIEVEVVPPKGIQRLQLIHRAGYFAP